MNTQKSVNPGSVSLFTLVLSGAGWLLSLYPLEPKVHTYARQYFSIFGGFGSVFIAFNMLQATILRTYGYTRDTMYISIIANLINVLGVCRTCPL